MHVIFDLDGTLADIEVRRKNSTMENGKINWNIFFDPDQIKFDEPNVSVIMTLRALRQAGHFIHILSGRSDATKDATLKWLDKHGVHFDSLNMRPQNKLFMPDDKLKQGWLDTLFPNKDEILCVFDDRDKVVKMWRQNGLRCFQVAPGDF